MAVYLCVCVCILYQKLFLATDDVLFAVGVYQLIEMLPNGNFIQTVLPLRVMQIWAWLSYTSLRSRMKCVTNCIWQTMIVIKQSVFSSWSYRIDLELHYLYSDVSSLHDSNRFSIICDVCIENILRNMYDFCNNVCW